MHDKGDFLNLRGAGHQELALQGAINHKGDFLNLLKHANYPLKIEVPPETLRHGADIEIAHSTTVVAVLYRDGVMIAGDRRATAGTSVIYDRAEKVLQIDRHSALAISGSPAIAYEIARILEHSFQYFRRSQLQELSLEGKLRMLSRLIRENLSMALQGIGGVIPIFALYDLNASEDGNGGKIFFYDALGAHFENVDFATTGSGSIWIRGVLRYLSRFGETALHEMDQRQAAMTILRLLDIASEYDAATSGYNAKVEIFPTVKTVTRIGVNTLSDDDLAAWYAEAQPNAEE
ncbi:proteasome subunit alpha [Candidatus Poribacteria bacterium]|nr:proteasome subunit alpha [Candidatus Poribacteria bacterium]MYH83588.1 proteasome subunit alpha [Candidatus Poribacteria bacterium]MYK93042.1 proteasome subunit alpha [Candidatus Poribacteria bacterium]